MSRQPKRTAPPKDDSDEWIFEFQAAELARLLDWVRAVDAKVPVLSAFSCAIIASVAAVTPAPDGLTLPTYDDISPPI